MAASTFRVRLFGANDQFLARWNITVPRVKKQWNSGFTYYFTPSYANYNSPADIDASYSGNEYVEAMTDRISWSIMTVESSQFTPTPNWPRRMQLFGYGNCIDLMSNYLAAGVKMMFDNGSYYLITRAVDNPYGGYGRGIYFDVYLSDGTKINTSEFIWFAQCNVKNSPRYPASGTTLPFPCGTAEGDYNCYRVGNSWDYQFNTDNIQFRGSLEKIGDVSGAMWQRFLEGLKDIDGDNPYYDGGVSEPGGGEGNFSDDSDTVESDSLPIVNVVGTGFATLFTPTKTQLKYLSNLFWSSTVFDLLQNLVENITDMFISLAMVPFTVTPGRTVSVTWLGIDTAIELRLAAAQYYEFDMGTIDLSDDSRIFTSGSVLDYSPFSRLGIYLPFIGYQELDIDECRDATVHLRYRIDILSGVCVAIISVGGNDIYQFTGNCLTQIPLTNVDMSDIVSDTVQVAISAATLEAAARGSMMAAEEGVLGSVAAEPTMHEALGNPAVTSQSGRLASATANAMISGKPVYKKTGAISSSASMLSVKQPYLYLMTPRQSIPDHYQRYCGFPSNITRKLGDLKGFTVVEDIRLNGLVATSAEVNEIYTLLKKGVII